MTDYPATPANTSVPVDNVTEITTADTSAIAAATAAAMAAEVAALPVRNVPSVRAVRRAWSRRLTGADVALVRCTANLLLDCCTLRWYAYELLAEHPEAMASLRTADLVALGRGMDSWGAVDTFARTLAGPAWVRGQVADEEIARWAASTDRWWRRAALVSTVALNERAHGPHGDADRTLAVCRLLLGDRDDMVVKAMSWALRSLAERDPAAVVAFLAETEGVLAARARREVQHKLDTGLKTPRRKALLRPQPQGDESEAG